MTHSISPAQPDRCDLSIRPLRNVEALRRPAFGTKGSQTGAIVEPVTRFVILTESSIEKKLARALYADNRVREVRHQAEKIDFIDADGKSRSHIVDLVATLHDGTRIGYIVKDEAWATKHDARGLVQLLATFTSSKRLDRLQLVTGRNLPEWSNQNARQIVNARRDRRTSVDDALRELAPTLLAPVLIGDLTASLGGGHVAFRPVVRAIYFGTLKYLGVGVISDDRRVKFSGIVMPDLDLVEPEIDENGEEPPVIMRPKKAAPQRRASYRAA